MAGSRVARGACCPSRLSQLLCIHKQTPNKPVALTQRHPVGASQDGNDPTQHDSSLRT